MASKILLILLCFLSFIAKAYEPPNWKELNFLRYKKAEYTVLDNKIEILSKSASSMIYRQLSDNEKSRNNLAWAWKVDESGVLPTPLNISPGDDRILGVYVFFTKKLTKKTETSLPRNGNYIAYVWGSSHKVGDIIKSKDSKGRYIIVRPHNQKQGIWLSESYDYKNDFQKAFGFTAYPAFIGIAADTDDSEAKTVASIKDIKFD
jgi:hypothetical protein